MNFHPDGYIVSNKISVKHGFSLKDFDLSCIENIVYPKTNQIHGDKVVYLDQIEPNRIYEADAWVTDKPGILCYVRTADCLPLLIHDPVAGLVAAIHSGWRSLNLHIISKTLKMMVDIGAKIGDLRAVLGPHICADCYEVGEDLIQKFDSEWNSEKIFHRKDKKLYLNLEKAAKEELLSFGIAKENIGSIDLCTKCRKDLFCSYRRDNDEKMRQINFIYL